MALTSGEQLRAARALLNLDKQELAQLAGISPNTLAKMEAVNGPLNVRSSTVRVVEAELVKRGVEILDGDAPGARLRRRVES